MDEITVLATDKNELYRWLRANHIKPLTLSTSDDLVQISIPYTTDAVEKICKLLQRLIVLKNPIVRESTLLKDNLINTLLDPLYASMLDKLTPFIADYGIIHLDGYITFKMQEYNFLIYKRLYAIIKGGPRP